MEIQRSRPSQMRVNRDDVVLVDYRFTTGGAKVRPPLVVQNDRDNVRMSRLQVAIWPWRIPPITLYSGIISRHSRRSPWPAFPKSCP